jgi:hypothetical protein
MSRSKLIHLLCITIVTLCLSSTSYQVQAATKGKHKVAQQSGKERLVLMPLHVPEEDADLDGAMESALVKGLQQNYDVFSGEQVAQKARAIYLKINKLTPVNTHCDETRCMQDIAEAFQAELIATSNVTKKEGSYFLSLSIQNIFDNQVVQSESLTCEKCLPTQVIEKLKILSGVVASNTKAAAAARRTNNKAQPTTFPSLEQALAELAQLNDKVASIEAGYEKELVDTRNRVSQRYSEKLDALKNEKRDEFDSVSEFETKQDKKRNEIITQRDAELARLNTAKVAAFETAPLKDRIKALNQHVYIVGAESIDAVLGEYDAEVRQFPLALNGKSPALKLKIEGSIPLRGGEAKVFKQQWHAGLIRPEAKTKLNGELVELSLTNEADNSRLNNYAGRFMTSRAAKAAVDAKLKLIKVGYLFQGGLTWMPISLSFSKTWSEANDFCNNTAINGQSGWRLPTKDELSALFNSGAMSDREHEGLFLTWSKTPRSDGNHFIVLLNENRQGFGFHTPMDTGLATVACVSETAEAALVTEPKQKQQAELPKGYVSQGGLTWMPISFNKHWTEANEYCNKTVINGHTGWRLPDNDELSALYMSIATKDQGWMLNYTWSSNVYNGNNFCVNLSTGGVNEAQGISNCYVTCVRLNIGL